MNFHLSKNTLAEGLAWPKATEILGMMGLAHLILATFQQEMPHA